MEQLMFVDIYNVPDTWLLAQLLCGVGTVKTYLMSVWPVQA